MGLLAVALFFSPSIKTSFAQEDQQPTAFTISPSPSEIKSVQATPIPEIVAAADFGITIIGGERVTASTYNPAFVFITVDILDPTTWLPGGIVISTDGKLVLTAANIVQNTLPTHTMYVVSNCYNLEDYPSNCPARNVGKVKRAKQQQYNPNWSEQFSEYVDLALLELEAPLSGIVPPLFADTTIAQPAEQIMVGFGCESIGGGYSLYQKRAAVRLLTPQTYTNEWQFTAVESALGGNGCTGDQGNFVGTVDQNGEATIFGVVARVNSNIHIDAEDTRPQIDWVDSCVSDIEKCLGFFVYPSGTATPTATSTRVLHPTSTATPIATCAYVFSPRPGSTATTSPFTVHLPLIVNGECT